MGRFVTYLLVALSVLILMVGRCFALDVRQVDWNGHSRLPSRHQPGYDPNIPPWQILMAGKMVGRYA